VSLDSTPIYTCVYTCVMCVHMVVRMCEYISACLCVCVCVCVSVCICGSDTLVVAENQHQKVATLYIHVYVCIHGSICVYIYVRVNMCVCVYVWQRYASVVVEHHNQMCQKIHPVYTYIYVHV